MKLKKSAMCLLATLLGSGIAFADADDTKWINQCIKDNKAEGATPAVVKKYCTCMNEKMSDNETRSISQWEKANPAAMKDCEKQSGWK